MFVLQLNDMRACKIELLTVIARAETREALEKYMKAEEVDSYRDGQWGKVYRKGGPLEWCNSPFLIDQCIVDVGSADSWALNARNEFENSIMGLPLIVG